MTNPLLDLFSSLRLRPDAPFLRLPGSETVTYGQAWAQSGRLANLLAEAGVRPGDRVAAQVEKTPEMLLLYLACLRVRAAFLPLNPAYTQAEMAYFLSDAEPAVVVCDPTAEAALRPLAGGAALFTLAPSGGGSLMVRAAGAEERFDDRGGDPGDLTSILYTSGTTGRSKGAMLSARNLASNAAALSRAWRMTASDVLLHALPIFHTHGLFVATHTVLTSGASMIFLPRFDIDAVFANLADATVMMGVPTFYVRMAEDARLTREACAHVRLFVSGSAPLLAETHRRFREQAGHAILERYGMTETNMNTSNPYDGERRPGTVGLPLPGVEVRVVDETTGRPAAQGEPGMIEVRGDNVFSGYWRKPELSASEFREDGFFVTGDLGTLDADGYLSIIGRSKDLVIAGGFNIYPKEVEDAIDAVEGVAESAVIGVPHPDLGEAVVAVVVPEAGAALDEAHVAAALRDRLARFKQPRRVILTDALPRNTMGKVQKNLLRDAWKDLFRTP